VNDKEKSNENRRNPRAIRALIAGGLLGAIVTAGFMLVIGMLLMRETVPLLTKDAYDGAVARWHAKGPANYNCDIELFGNRPGQVHVEVRGKQVVRMTRDGVEPSQRRTWEYWTVDGQLDTIEQELEMLNEPQPFGAPSGTHVFLYAQFDPELGYPIVYRRTVLGASLDMAWKVSKFEAIRD
jgi:hypothetical protein